MKINLLRCICIICIVCVLSGCGGSLHSKAYTGVNFNTWLAYWDIDDGLAEYKKVQGNMQSLSYFAAYFDEKDRLFVPKEIQKAKASLGNQEGKTSYLTIVNDKALGNDEFAEKDLGVLRRTFGDEISLNHHVRDIIKLARQGGYDGVEIDYEQLWKDETLPPLYVHFLDILYRHASSQGLKVRVILEPSAKFGAGFCEGPQYAVMFYNLYGTHSGPGPKADAAFIQKTLKRMAVLPGSPEVVFATGGCQWGPGDKKKFIDEADAVELVKNFGVTPQRDAASGALHFTYMDKDKSYTVWYADQETLNAWISLAVAQGIHKAGLWRLGGNVNLSEVKNS